METGLAGRTVVVTGATANIGRGIAIAFAAEGTHVVVVGRDEVAGARVCDALLAGGAKDALWHAADASVAANSLSRINSTSDATSCRAGLSGWNSTSIRAVAVIV